MSGYQETKLQGDARVIGQVTGCCVHAMQFKKGYIRPVLHTKPQTKVIEML